MTTLWVSKMWVDAFMLRGYCAKMNASGIPNLVELMPSSSDVVLSSKAVMSTTKLE